MNSYIEVARYHIENNTLFVKVKGFICGPSVEKMGLTVIFRNGKWNRRFPIEADCFYSEEEKGCFFTGKANISLPDVFYLKEGEELSEETKVFVEVFNSQERFCQVMEDIILSKELFIKKAEKKSFLFSIYKVLATLICILLLPLFVADGYFAVKGYKPLDTGEHKALGLRGILRHANELTKRICGFAYSLREVKTNYLRHCYIRYCKQPVRDNNILLLSERLLEENSNMALIKEELSKEDKLVLTEFIRVKTVDKLTFGEIRESAKKMAEARCILLEDFYPQLHALPIRKETKVMQLWHACGAYKAFGFTRHGKPGGPPQDTKNHRYYDYTIVSGQKIVPVYSEAFGIPEESVKTLGVPRTDIFFREGYREETRKRLYRKYPMLLEKKVVLFAPTFRGDENKTAYYPTDKIDWNQFFEQMPEDYVVILKNHPFVKSKYSYDRKWENRVLDLTGRDNINDLLFVTDLLITDFSSSVFEAALLNVPMVFYVFDKKEYLETRDIYYDFDSFVPGRQVKTQEELFVAVKEAISGNTQMDEKYQWFKEEFLDALSGNSTKAVADFIKETVMEI